MAVKWIVIALVAAASGWAATEVYFSPGNQPTAAIVRELGQVKSNLLVQAFSFTSAPPPYLVGRIVALRNIIELATTGSPVGIHVSSTSGTKTRAVVDQLVFRQNQIRYTDGNAGPTGTLGIYLDVTNQAIVEENLSVEYMPDTEVQIATIGT